MALKRIIMLTMFKAIQDDPLTCVSSIQFTLDLAQLERPQVVQQFVHHRHHESVLGSNYGALVRSSIQGIDVNSYTACK